MAGNYTPSNIRIVVFDLADVLLDFAGPESLFRLSTGRVGPKEFDLLWSSPLADELYRGKCSPEEFATRAVDKLGLTVSPQLFLNDFASWFRGPYPGALDLVAQVHPGHVLFFDDNPANVAAARRVGLQAYEVRGTKALRSRLVELGVLPPATPERKPHLAG